MMLSRLCVTGSDGGAAMSDVFRTVGKEAVLRRLAAGIAQLRVARQQAPCGAAAHTPSPSSTPAL
jgi:hypothetical protein